MEKDAITIMYKPADIGERGHVTLVINFCGYIESGKTTLPWLGQHLLKFEKKQKQRQEMIRWNVKIISKNRSRKVVSLFMFRQVTQKRATALDLLFNREN